MSVTGYAGTGGQGASGWEGLAVNIMSYFEVGVQERSIPGHLELVFQ